MTARDKVFARLGGDAQWFRHVLYGLAGETFEAQEALDKFEAALAHELAEQIREDFRREFSRATANMGVAPAQRWILGGDRAADLIDPDTP